MLEDSSI